MRQKHGPIAHTLLNGATVTKHRRFRQLKKHTQPGVPQKPPITNIQPAVHREIKSLSRAVMIPDVHILIATFTENLKETKKLSADFIFHFSF